MAQRIFNSYQSTIWIFNDFLSQHSGQQLYFGIIREYVSLDLRGLNQPEKPPAGVVAEWTHKNPPPKKRCPHHQCYAGATTKWQTLNLKTSAILWKPVDNNKWGLSKPNTGKCQSTSVFKSLNQPARMQAQQKLDSSLKTNIQVKISPNLSTYDICRGDEVHLSNNLIRGKTSGNKLALNIPTLRNLHPSSSFCFLSDKPFDACLNSNTTGSKLKLRSLEGGKIGSRCTSGETERILATMGRKKTKRTKHKHWICCMRDSMSWVKADSFSAWQIDQE